MTNYYLRMEGVNLATVIGDTQDLSTIRGGGLLLLNAVQEAKKQMPNLHEISTGASAGLFSFQANSDKEAEKLRDALQSHFKEHERYRHFTFVVDVAKKTNDFSCDRETLLTLNRYRQLQSPSLAIPAMDDRCKHPCTTDLVRPQSTIEKHYGKDGARISASVFQRREYGRDEKQHFYENETDTPGLKNFASDFGSIGSDSRKGNLHNKLAVIYLDGNGFGNLQTACTSDDELSKFDQFIKGKRREFLKAFLEQKVQKEEGWIFKSSDKEEYRFEILLWGGDEMIFVVPAWKGWETLQFFYEQTANWEYGGSRLTHAGGMAFCHHKAHIHRITDLAKELADMTKEISRKKNLFIVKALESFDHISQDTEGYFKEQTAKITGESDSYAPLVLDGEKMLEIANEIGSLKRSEFPRSKIYQYLKELLSVKHEDAGKTIAKAMIGSGCDDAITKLGDLLNGDAMRWMHIAELWDYIQVQETVTEGGAA